MKLALLVLVTLLTQNLYARTVETAYLTEYYVFGTNPDNPGESVQNDSTYTTVNILDDEPEIIASFEFGLGSAKFQSKAKRLKDVKKIHVGIEDLGYYANNDEYTYLGSVETYAVVVARDNSFTHEELSCQLSQYSGRVNVTCFFRNGFDNLHFVFKR